MTKKQTSNKTCAVNIYMEPALVKELDKVCLEVGRSRSSFFNVLFRQYIRDIKTVKGEKNE